MIRYRPPQAKSSPYITPAGYQALQQELNGLWRRRQDVSAALAAAAAEGDRSENAEYIYRKKELRELDRRIRYLQKRLPELTVVTQTPSDPSRVFFGARITVENDQGQATCMRIVGADELDLAPDHISIDSPMARAALKKALDDEIRVRAPGGEQVFILTGIEYP